MILSFLIRNYFIRAVFIKMQKFSNIGFQDFRTNNWYVSVVLLHQKIFKMHLPSKPFLGLE